MAFLYRYANLRYPNDVYFCNENELYDCLDANQIYNGLVTAMEWSISNGILAWPTSDYRLYPTASVQRKELALFVNRYSCNVDGILERERYSFQNHKSYFESAKEQDNYNYYMITGYHLAKLNSGLETATNEQLGTAITEKREGNWIGACYGMIATCILDKLGKIGLNECMAHDCISLNTIPSFRSYTNYKHILVHDNVNQNCFALAESAILFDNFSFTNSFDIDGDANNNGY